MWRGFREFNRYNRKQRNGLMVLALLALLLNLLLYFHDLWPREELLIGEPEAWQEWQSLQASAREAEVVDSLFPFDPNKIGLAEWQQLGLSVAQARGILNYRRKGGRFRAPEDLARMYTIDSASYARLHPWVQIEQEEYWSSSTPIRPALRLQPFDPNQAPVEKLLAMGLQKGEVRGILGYREKVKTFQEKEELYRVYALDSALVQKLLPFVRLDSSIAVKPHENFRVRLVPINKADSLLWESLPGIGPVLSQRIIAYRQELGGFHSIDQLGEVYGLRPEVLEALRDRFTVDDEAIKRLNLNKASFEELMAHPYLEYQVVRNILHFRERVRAFRSVDELRHIELIDGLLFSKIAAYLTVEDHGKPEQNFKN